MQPFATEHDRHPPARGGGDGRSTRRPGTAGVPTDGMPPEPGLDGQPSLDDESLRRSSRQDEVVAARRDAAPRETPNLVAALRRCRQPVPARVAVDRGRPVRVTTDRRAFVGGAVSACSGPWRVSGDWWRAGARASTGERAADGARTRAPGAERTGPTGNGLRRPVRDTADGNRPSATGMAPRPFDTDEWDVVLSDGAAYRIFQDRETEGWFIDGIVD
jgi:hypothetical protein